MATGHANVRSLLNALDRLGVDAALTEDPETLRRADRAILPGVGAFGAVAGRLRALGLMQALKDRLAAGRPLLGICLGLQLLMESSEESAGVEGLGAFPGGVSRLAFHPGAKVPHMGWSLVEPVRRDPVLGERPFHAYFVHSYAARPRDPSDTAAWCDEDGDRFPAAIRRGETVAVQFHPERSGPAGLALLERFAKGGA